MRPTAHALVDEGYAIDRLRFSALVGAQTWGHAVFATLARQVRLARKLTRPPRRPVTRSPRVARSTSAPDLPQRARQPV